MMRESKWTKCLISWAKGNSFPDIFQNFCEKFRMTQRSLQTLNHIWKMPLTGKSNGSQKHRTAQGNALFTAKVARALG